MLHNYVKNQEKLSFNKKYIKNFLKKFYLIGGLIFFAQINLEKI